jgi:UDP-N-acetylmuramate--alanine ligase
MDEYLAKPGSIPTLPVPDLSAVRAIHLVGIGGAGMSGIARLFLSTGVRVTGSDLKWSPGLQQLETAGASVRLGHAAANLDRPDAVVVSTAIPANNPEVAAARAGKIPVLARAQVLAALMRDRRGIAIAGTHGKTTTTSMIAVLLERTGRDPTYVIGGDLNESGSNARFGEGELFVAEADESDGSFLLLSPEIAVVTNVDDDHLDFYKDRQEVEAAFVAFCRRAGTVVACGDDDAARRVLHASGTPAITYGESHDNDVVVEVVELGQNGGRCRVSIAGRTVDVAVSIPGRHYLQNAAAALSVANLIGIPPEEAAQALNAFTGVRRRFERRGSSGGAVFVDDYAHHPVEVAATLDAARTDGMGRLVAVFQPHRYSRTAALSRQLGESLSSADLIVVTDVYGAGELPVPGISGKLVVDALLETAPGKRAVYLPRRSDVAPFLAREVRSGDLILTLGAGDITMVGEETLARLASQSAVPHDGNPPRSPANRGAP